LCCNVRKQRSAVGAGNPSNHSFDANGVTMNNNTRKTIVGLDRTALRVEYASPDPDCRYNHARALFHEQNYAGARRLYSTIDTDHVTPTLRAHAINDLAVLDAFDERFHAARAGFRRALTIDPTCENARRNLAMLESCGCGAEA
jgi:Flp pilus assembly protein TadD